MTETPDLLERVQHGYADNNGVKIHYATIGRGPLMVMIHGFPDFWYTWRNQMDALSDRFHIVAVDLRATTRATGPKGLRTIPCPSLPATSQQLSGI